MNETYTAVAGFAQTWGLLYFVILFAIVVAYALWPKNRKSFDDAAQIPLRED
ncbi:cytochrome c oxidase cbb3-type subunit 4 [Roseibium hamelinense]|uniref:Cytochrome c oxidase cbb3-type subunit 4 n=1 Tax=Roseibium hamelinense TaxID=150831 RepID=A0A562SUF8_9HYPH|nr:cbb3-type cytochrome c oxidase subunit 3 [Roseibium hamelinense]MTI42425.1 cbb3-type cytochrome c oxidase subunit 3 [Roseibium hamelinense]TWI84688.1 cytochrome c oxidase cbb3-type subunit 4 [Roseibium hamelinense]